MSMTNMDSSSEDFALLLLAEEEAAISKKNRGPETNKHTNVTKIIVS